MSATNRRGLIIFGLIVLFAIVVCGWLPFSFLPGSNVAPGIPVIQVPGEVLVYHWKPFGIDLGKDFNLLNTMVALFIVDVIVLLFAFFAYRSSNGWRNRVPGRFQAFVELIAGGIYNLCKSIGGEAGRQVFPLVATIFFFLLISNWMGIIPGIESVGQFHCAYPGTSGYAGTRISDGQFQLNNPAPLKSGFTVSLADHVNCIRDTGIGHLHAKEAKEALKQGLIDPAHEHVEVDEATGEVHVEFHVPAERGSQELLDLRVMVPDPDNEGQMIESEEPVYKFHITPFVRSAATDLNLTVALALISFTTIQVFGFRALGLNYMQKFIPIHDLGNAGKNPLGLMNLIVGPLELLSELSKIVSLSFRLFGNIFAGASLLAVMLFLVGSGIPMIFYFLELIVGFMQALVFAALTLVFTSQAVQSHIHDDEHEEAHH